MKVYGLKVAIKHEKEKDGILININKKPTLYASIEEMGDEAKKRLPQLNIGYIVISPFVASASIDEICYVSAYDLIGFFKENVIKIENFVLL